MAYLSTVFNYTIQLFSAIIASVEDLCPELIPGGFVQRIIRVRKRITPAPAGLQIRRASGWITNPAGANREVTFLRALRAIGPYLFIVLSCLTLGFGPPVLTDSDLGNVRLYPHQIEAIAALSMPEVTAQAAIVSDVASGQILAEKNAHQRLAPASTTKIATALVALQRGQLEEQVVVHESALIEGAKMGLSSGQVVTLEELLYGLLLRSGNDAATAIAQHIGGSADSFVEMMNQEAEDLGLTDTHFINPHGLDAPNHYASAYDLMMIARQALANPTFAEIVSTQEYTFRGRRLSNRNELLGNYPGADGVKTGTTSEAGECLVASATRDGHQVLVVVLGTEDRYGDASTLLDYYFDNYAWYPLEIGSGPLNRFQDSEGVWHTMGLRDHAEVFLPRWQGTLLRCFRQVNGERAAEASEPVGTAFFYAGPWPQAQLPLYIMED
jgi:D-alanyl-D-alanine carboxypeptidase (penicillin-binding protein 5/6)